MKLSTIAQGFETLSQVFKNEWFEAYALPHNIYAIHEPHHIQGVTSYLIIGQKKALLFDTGAGIGNIKEVVEALTDLELIVVNSHCHFDHIGDNYRFPAVHAFNCESSLHNLRQGYSAEELAPEMVPENILAPLPAICDLATYQINPSQPIAIESGHIFDLGNRTIEAIHAAGHAPDCLVLFDAEARLMLPGDTLYNGPIYAHFDGRFYGKSSLQEYLDTLRMLSSYSDRVDTLYPSHGEPILGISAYEIVANALEQIITHQAPHVFQIETREQFLDASLPAPDENTPASFPDNIPVYGYEFEGGYSNGGYIVYSTFKPA